MQDKGRRVVDPEAEDRRDEGAVLRHVVETHPGTLRLSDLIRELSDDNGFGGRDRIERAVRELVKGGLLFRCEGVILPTRQSLYLWQTLELS
jgi:hypothetical protein